MKAKKIVALATGFALCFSVATASLLQAGAADVQTVTPEPVTTGYSNPKLVMYPGNVYWGNVGEITEWNPAGNPGYNYTEHVYSQYAKYATGQVIYKPLDVYLNEGREGMDHNEGVYNKDNPSLYRDALFYGTFQGVRIDYALQPKSADSNLEFRIAPGSYVASALLLSDYWMKSAPNKELYQDIDSTWKLESSADGITWTELSDVDYYWEHGDKEGNIAVSGYRTLIASAKLPDKTVKAIRKYASTHARRHWVLLDAHTHGMTYKEGGQTKLLLDFHSYPIRPKDLNQTVKADGYQPVILETGYIDSIFGKSVGGVHPAGWKTDSNPFLVEFDNSGYEANDRDYPKGTYHPWGYDEITWFARQPASRRTAVIREFYRWINDRYPNGHLQFPTRVPLAYGFELKYTIGNESVTLNNIYYFKANRQSQTAIEGFGLEDTLKSLWKSPR